LLICVVVDVAVSADIRDVDVAAAVAGTTVTLTCMAISSNSSQQQQLMQQVRWNFRAVDSRLRKSSHAL